MEVVFFLADLLRAKRLNSQLSSLDAQFMGRALELAGRGEGYVEPNPLVGCVIVRDRQVVGEGWHGRFGGPHAEIEALGHAGAAARGATMYVTLEPCCHRGKTPPCVDAILQAQLRRVVVAQQDPFPEVSGQGVQRLRQSGLEVVVGVCQAEARQQSAPYLKLVQSGRPWVIAKWAMTLDGKIATRSGNSQWISGEKSRRLVHQLRGRMDGILVGIGTAQQDDPLLTARPPGPRVATRIVLDSTARLSAESRLAQTASEVPVLIATSSDAPPENLTRFAACQTYVCGAATRRERFLELLDELGRRRMTNLLIEGGGQVLGTAFDADAVDEVHVFISPKIIGGTAAPSPVGGEGLERMALARRIVSPVTQQIDGDIYLHGRLH